VSGGLAVGPYLNGLDLVMLAGWCNLNSYQLITRPEIRRPEDLRGKVIGIGRYGAAADWALRLILRKLGINEHKDVQIIQAGGGGPATRLGAMEAKKLDATVLDSPQTVQARRLGFRTLADGVELGIPFLQGGLVTRRSYVKANETTPFGGPFESSSKQSIMPKPIGKPREDHAEIFTPSKTAKPWKTPTNLLSLNNSRGCRTPRRPPSRSFSSLPLIETRAPRPQIPKDSSTCDLSGTSSRAAQLISCMPKRDSDPLEVINEAGVMIRHASAFAG
jgi:hypothetical protein